LNETGGLLLYKACCLSPCAYQAIFVISPKAALHADDASTDFATHQSSSALATVNVRLRSTPLDEPTLLQRCVLENETATTLTWSSPGLY
ncbi:hypothetical protein KCU64_g100, partial [Aureobasidium melanogenum]